jgi:hypothetical protein
MLVLKSYTSYLVHETTTGVEKVPVSYVEVIEQAQQENKGTTINNRAMLV